ncbi:type II toxin-antitoxin system RelE/ParE family toxin [Amorphus sp. 3PC139-8]|uniref:type II toxin-antitoxin system RelE/ParE family toxin n=1 Tax=Amorphus sp. 3PC139-8 TaxID=2735676 RepID=UPI00345D5652
MIRSIKHKGLWHFAETGDPSKLGTVDADRIRRILARLDVSVQPHDMNLPGLAFQYLADVRLYAVRIRDKSRIRFGWHGEDAVDVDLEHRT